ncbi:MAG TPA: 30S ribosomal protein S17 [Patescibacteria group bacterium]|jgi:small subunit ribosomal protein S17|nr:30S ribosomal protein S17 [Patescibacteria group bacterium]
MDKQTFKKHLIGIITSDKMAKTVVVKVESMKVHPKYQKRYKVFKKYAAHVDTADYKIGDKVEMEEAKPMSRTKSWKVIRKLE